MFRHVKYSSDTTVKLFPLKENIAMVLRSFEVVADDFLEYVLVGGRDEYFMAKCMFLFLSSSFFTYYSLSLYPPFLKYP